jgi:branched-chain amino acid transport system permease protein
MDVPNVAHGELYMIGAVIGFFAIDKLGFFWPGLGVAIVVVFFLGVAIERGILRPIEDDPIRILIATFGLIFVFQHVALIVFGGAPRRIEPPITESFHALSFDYPIYRIVVGIIAVIILIGLYFMLYRTKFGLWIRASTQDRDMAMAMGIPVNRVFMWTFGLGAALGAIGGVLASPILAIEYSMGLEMTVLAFIVVIVGGIGSLKGTLIGAIIIGELEGIGSVLLNPTEARMISLLVLAVVLLVRPKGLFKR